GRQDVAVEGRRREGARGHRGGVAVRQAQLARGPRADVQLLSGHDDAQERVRLRDDRSDRGRLHEAGDEARGREADGLDRGLEGLKRRTFLSTYELVVNVKTAKALGLNLRASIVQRARA